jgi:hypothetical protein
MMMMMTSRLLLPVLAGIGLAGCVAYPVAGPPPPRVVYATPGPPAPVYVQPAPRRRVWVPRRCDPYGRCRGGFWRWV